MPQITDHNVNLKVEIPKSLDRAIEEAAFRRDTTKKAVVELAIRAFLKLPKSEAAA